MISVTRLAASLPFAGALFPARQASAQPAPTFTPSPRPSPSPAPGSAPSPSPGGGPSPDGGPSPGGRVPEPASIVVLASGLAIGGAGLMARRISDKIRLLLERWAEDDEE